MKVSTKADAIKVTLELSEDEALSLGRLVDERANPYYTFTGSTLSGLSREINNAISKARNEVR